MSHKRLGPSKSARVILCAASPNREALYPDEAGPSAKGGSNYHWLAEQALVEDQWPPLYLKEGIETAQSQAPYPEVDMTREFIDHTEGYYRYIKRRAEELKPSVIRTEIEVSPGRYTDRDDDGGTLDAAIVSDGLLEIVDYKTGGIQVEPDASQLKLYALGAMAEYADPLSGLAPFPKIRLTVYQPLRPGMDSVERSQDFTQHELIDWAMTVWSPAANASDDPNAKATPSDEACKYCKAAKNGGCPEYTAFVENAAAQLFQPTQGQAIEIVDQFMTEFRADQLSNDQIARFLEAWPLMKARAKDIEENALERLKQRIEIPGFKAVAGRGSRAWAHEDEEQAKKFRNMKLKKGDIFVEKLKSPNQLLNSNLSTKQKELVKKHVVNKAGALTIAPVSDRRRDEFPPVEFQPVEQSETSAPAVDLSFLQL